MSVNKNQRVAVFVDVQNMYYSAKNIYKSKVNFAAILATAVQGRQLTRAFSYVIKADVGEEVNFFEALEKIGYEVKSKDLQVFFGGAKKGDWDVGIAMDIVRMAEKVDVIILVSGDGDFKELLEYVQAKGCRAEVMAFGRSASSKLKEAADLFLDMDKNYSRYLIKSPGMRGRRPFARRAEPGERTLTEQSEGTIEPPRGRIIRKRPEKPASDFSDIQYENLDDDFV